MHKSQDVTAEGFSSEALELLRCQDGAAGRGRRIYDDLASGSQLIARHRNAYRYALLLLAVALAPVNTYHVLENHWLPAAAGITLLILLLVNFWQLSRQRSALIPLPAMVVLTLAMIVISSYYGQTYTLYWLYPLLVALPVLLSTRWAVWLAVLCGLLATPLVFMQYELQTAIIICLSMLHTWLISAWLVYVVTQQSKRLEDIALTDPLTGAYNRRCLQLKAQLAMEVYRRFDRPACMLLIDVDNFKAVNDRYGHTVGDAALRALVKLLQKRLRSEDTLCRFGGEEFAVLLMETSQLPAQQLAVDLCQLVAQADILPQGPMTVSIGVGELQADQSLDDWLQCVDQALYSAKSCGRNQVMAAPQQGLSCA